MIFKDNKIVLIKIDQNYLSSLYDACKEVYFKFDSGYERKPYVGILISIGGNKYAIPLTSAKEKHKCYKNYSNGKMLIFENAKPTDMSNNDIWTILTLMEAPNICYLFKHCKNDSFARRCFSNH